MTDVLKMSRKALTMGVVLTTILWSMMATVLVAPLTASAAGCTSGSLIKGSLAAVYYCGGDGKRYVFPGEKTYKTWYSDFSGVTTISDADLASIQIGGNATYRPGVKMVKITTDPKVYVVAKGGVLRPIASEAVASALYGSTWNKQIDDLADAFFTNYTVGAAVNAAGDFSKDAEMSSSQSINADKNLSSSSSGSGQVMASLASDSPAGSTVPKGATSVNVLKFSLKNSGSSAATVDSVTIHRTGPGAPADITSLYLYEGSSRLSTGRTVNTSTNDAIFSGLGLMLGAGEMKTLWVAMDRANTTAAGNVHAFSVSGATAGSATVGGLPISGSSFTFADATVGDLTIAKTGSITNPKAGQTGVMVAQFTIAAGSAEDVWVNRLRLFQGGNLSGANLKNLKLKQAGTELASASGLDSKLGVTFNLAAPLKLEKGATKTFDVWADVGGAARSGDTLRLYVEENADLFGTGATYGHGVRVTRTAYDNGSNDGTDASWSTVEGGQITISFNGPSSANYASNGKDVELYNFTLASGGNVEVRTIKFTIDCGPASSAGGCHNGTEGNYTDIKVVNTATGQVWWGPQDLGTSSDTTQTLTFTEVQNLAAGSSQTFKVTADIKSTVPANDTIKATLVAFGGSDLRNLDNSTFVATSDIVPAGNVAGNQHTIKAPSLVVSIGSTPVSQSFVKGSMGVPMLGVNLQAGDGADIKVTAMTLTGFIDEVATSNAAQGKETTTSVAEDILSCKLFDGTTQVGDTKSPTTSSAVNTGGLLQFTNLNLTVAKSSTKSLLLKCDLSNSAVADNRVAFAVQASSDVTAQDPDGNALVAGTTLTGTANVGVVTGGTAPAVMARVLSAGTLSFVIAPDDTESEAGLAIAGGTDRVLGKFRVTASNEELKLTKIMAFIATASNDSVGTMKLCDGTNCSGDTAVTVASASGTAQFSGLNIVIPKDGSKTLTVKGSLNTIANGADSNDDLMVSLKLPGTSLEGAAGSSLDSSTFEALGTSSSTVIRQPTSGNTSFLAGNSKILRKTKPTVSAASLPTTVLTNGGGVVAARFTVTADGAENISLKKMAFKISTSTVGDLVGTSAAATAGTNATIGIREVGQGSDISASSTSAYVHTTNAGNSCSGVTLSTTTWCVVVNFTSEQVISAGTSKTYELRLTVSGFAASESMSTTLLGDTANAYGALTQASDADAGIGGTKYNFMWSDNTAIPHSTSSADWTNGQYVKVLPGDAQTLTRS